MTQTKKQYLWDGKVYNSSEEVIEQQTFKNSVDTYLKKYGSITVTFEEIFYQNLITFIPYFSLE